MDFDEVKKWCVPARALDVYQSGFFFELDVPGTEASIFYLNSPSYFIFLFVTPLPLPFLNLYSLRSFLKLKHST